MSYTLSDAFATNAVQSGFAAAAPAGYIIELRDGVRPASANTAPTGTARATGTLPASPWTAAANRKISKNATLQVTGLAAAGAGTIVTWGRIRAAGDNGLTDATQPRWDFDVVQAPASGDCVVDNPNIAQNQVLTLNTAAIGV